MQAITDELIEILASRHQAGTRGFGCRVEIDHAVAEVPESGSAGTIVQYAEGSDIDDTTAAFASPVTAGNLIVAVLTSGPSYTTPEMAAGSGYTHLGSATAIARNAAGTDDAAVRIFAKVAAGGEQTISREATSANVQINVVEIADVDLSDITVLELDRQDVASPALCDLGSFADAYGAAVVGMVLTRSNTGQWIGLSCAPASGWTERSDRRIDANPSGPTGPWQYIASAVPAGGTLDPAMTATIVTYAPQDIADFAGVAVLFGNGTAAIPAHLETTGYAVTSCSLDKSRRLTASQADIEIAIADDAGVLLAPAGEIVTNAPLRIYQWYGDPANEVLVFTGSIDEIREGRDVRTLRIVARDMMKRLIEQNITLIAPQGADEDGDVRTTANYVYLNMDVDAILDDLLDKAGVPTADRDITPTSYALDEFLGADGASFAATIIGDDRLTGLTGYDLWADEQGILHFGPVNASQSADSDTDPVPAYSYIVGDYATGEETSGLVTRLDRSVDEYELRTRVKVRGNIAIATPAWTEEWSSGVLTKPVGTMYVPADPTHIYVLDSGTRKIYKILQSTRAKVTGGIWPKSVAADATYPIGLSRDPADADVFYVLEAPYWTTGAITGNKIHKYDLSDGSHDDEWSLPNGKWTSIKVSSAFIWLANWTTDKLYKRSKVDGSAIADYTVTYLGDAQVNPTGIAIDGTTLLVFFYGKARFLIVDESDPTTIDTTNALGITAGKISTAGTKIMGGEVDTATHAHLHANSDALGRIWKFTLTEPDTDEVFSEVIDTDLEDELGFLMSAADREHDSHTGDADHAYEIRRETLDIHKLLSNIAQATETATRRLDLLAHRQETLDVGTVGNPALQRNDLVGMIDAVTGVDANYVIDTLRSNMDTRGFFMTLALLPYSPAW